MKVSVVIVTYNEEHNLGDCLNSIFAINYPKKDYEVLIVDGGSKDNTLDIVKEFQKKHKNLRWITDPKSFLATSRNLGFKKAKYDYIAYTDAGCMVPKDWFKKLTSAYTKLSKKHEKLAGVGGANKPPKSSNKFARAYSITQKTFLGSLGSVQAKIFSEPKEVKSISCCNSLFSRKALLDSGGFPGKRSREAEDWELNYKLRKKGYKVMVIPNLFVWKKFRDTPYKFFKHMILYGNCRMLIIKKYPETLKSIYLLPILFLLAMLGIVLAPFHRIFLLPLLYFPLTFFYSIMVARREHKPEMASHVFTIFVLQHFGYAIGELKELFKRVEK